MDKQEKTLELPSDKIVPSNPRPFFRRFGIWIIVFVICLLFLGGAFVLFSKKAIDTSHWSEYQGNGFTFTYPPNLRIVSEDSAVTEWVTNKQNTDNYPLVLEKGTRSFYSNLTADKDTTITDKEAMTINGKKLQSFRVQTHTTGSCSGCNERFVTFNVNGTDYRLDFDLSNKAFMSQIDTILSSLKFSNNTSEANSSLSPIDSSPTPTNVPTQLNVMWNPEPELVSSVGFFSLADEYYPFSLEYFLPPYAATDSALLADSYEKNATYYRVGTINSGMYKGGAVYLGIVKNLPQPHAYKAEPTLQDIKYDLTQTFLFIQTLQGQFVLTGDYDNDSISCFNLKAGKCVLKTDKIVFKNNDFLDSTKTDNQYTLTNRNGKEILNIQRTANLFSQEREYKVTNLDKNRVLYASENTAFNEIPLKDIFGLTFEVRLPSGLVATADDSTHSNGGAEVGAAINWNKGESPEKLPLDEYDSKTYAVGTYGIYYDYCEQKSDDLSIASGNAVLDTQQLQSVGTTQDGDVIYAMQAIPDTVYSSLFTNRVETDSSLSNITYPIFLSARPILFLKNSLGIYQAIYRQELVRRYCFAEPLIYLYPQKTTQVSVHVSSNLKLTQSEPAYNNGWTVTAHPNGTLFASGSDYPYPFLYWEGDGPLPQNPVDVDVVRQSDIHIYLNKELARLGLNTAETKAFENFWENKLTGSLYYKLTFYGTKSLDSIVPLSISPRPNSVVRVLMDYEPLSKKENVTYHDRSFKTPQRNGFTVVELGGLLHAGQEESYQ